MSSHYQPPSRSSSYCTRAQKIAQKFDPALGRPGHIKRQAGSGRETSSLLELLSVVQLGCSLSLVTLEHISQQTSKEHPSWRMSRSVSTPP